jgi:hypothetical protein
MKLLRLFADDDGESPFEDVDITGKVHASSSYPAEALDCGRHLGHVDLCRSSIVIGKARDRQSSRGCTDPRSSSPLTSVLVAPGGGERVDWRLSARFGGRASCLGQFPTRRSGEGW